MFVNNLFDNVVDTGKMNRRLNRAKSFTQSLEYKIEEGTRINDHHETISKSLRDAEHVRSLQNNLLNAQRQNLKVYQAEELAYKDRRLAYIAGYITEALSVVFPDDGFIAELKSDISRGKGHARLKLVDKLGRSSRPANNEGKFNQELVGFAGSHAVINGFGKNTMYVDEVFAAADSTNREKASVLIKHMVENGIQVFLVSQVDSTYRNLSRREFHPRKNPTTLISTLSKVVDY